MSSFVIEIFAIFSVKLQSPTSSSKIPTSPTFAPIIVITTSPLCNWYFSIFYALHNLFFLSSRYQPFHLLCQLHEYTVFYYNPS